MADIKDKIVYKHNLFFNYILSLITNIVFESFNLMFERTIIVDEPDICLKMLDTGYSTYMIHLYLDDESYMHLDIYVNGVLIKKDIQPLSFDNHNEQLTDAFIKSGTTAIIEEYMSLVSGEDRSVAHSNIVKTANIGFMKRIKEIKDIGYMHKYAIVFEDQTIYHVLAQDELSPSLSIETYGHLDENDNFIFVPQNLVQ